MERNASDRGLEFGLLWRAREDIVIVIELASPIMGHSPRSNVENAAHLLVAALGLGIVVQGI